MPQAIEFPRVLSMARQRSGGRAPVTAVVLTFNNEQIIERTLRSVAFCEEIVVVDSGSTDRTVEICERWGASVFLRALDGFDTQRNYGAERASCSWILALDSDEEVSPELADEIVAAVREDQGVAAYQVNLTNYFLGSPIRYRSGPSGFGAKLYRKSSARFTGSVHERLVIDGKVGFLKHPIASYCQPTLRSIVASYNLYTDKEADAIGEVGYWHLIYPPLRRLVGHLFVLGALREGKRGFIKAVLDSFYAFLLAAKRWEKGLPYDGNRPQ
jgi:glycosyltransferase involved in cell wall biosynthesis